MHEAAALRGGMVRKFGIAGLIVFVPFWMTGPVVGSIIGFLIGLRPWVNLALVLTTAYVAIGLWALLLNELSAWAATFDRLAVGAAGGDRPDRRRRPTAAPASEQPRGWPGRAELNSVTAIRSRASVQCSMRSDGTGRNPTLRTSTRWPSSTTLPLRRLSPVSLYSKE